MKIPSDLEVALRGAAVSTWFRREKWRSKAGAIILAAMMLGSSAVIACAEVATALRPAGATPTSAAKSSQPSPHEIAVADCERMWDRGTHMTKKEWSQTCRRVQDRLRQIEAR